MKQKITDMILPIYLYGSDVLRRENVDVDLNDKEGIAKLLEDMWETLKVADGCGLAASFCIGHCSTPVAQDVRGMMI